MLLQMNNNIEIRDLKHNNIELENKSMKILHCNKFANWRISSLKFYTAMVLYLPLKFCIKSQKQNTLGHWPFSPFILCKNYVINTQRDENVIIMRFPLTKYFCNTLRHNNGIVFRYNTGQCYRRAFCILLVLSKLTVQNINKMSAIRKQMWTITKYDVNGQKLKRRQKRCDV